MALAAQRKGARVGNVNPALYGFAARQAGGGAAVFHDLTAGNNTVPGVTGFSAGGGYDPATGLGSVDAAQLINHWNDPAGPSFQLSATPALVTVTTGSSASVSLKLAAGGGFNSAVTLSATGLPSGITAAFTPATLPAGTTSSALQISASANAAPGSFSFNISGSGGGVTNTLAVQATVSRPCTYTINPTAASAAAAASSYSVQVTAPAGCSWSASKTTSWITLTSGATGSGNGTVAYAVDANAATAPRSGSIAVSGAGQNPPVTLTVSQAGVPCTYSVTPKSATVVALAGSYTLQVSAQSGCSWTAASNSSFLSVTAGASGSGNGPVTYAAAPNTSAARSGTLTVAGVTVNITQSAPEPGKPVFSLSPGSAGFTAPAAAGTVAVTASVSTATWTAVSNAGWIKVTSGASGKGSQNVGYSVAANTGTSSRTATLTIAGVVFTVTQAAVACKGSLGTPVVTPNSGGFAITFPVAIAAGCAWTATSDQPWLTVTSGATGTGSGKAIYQAATNTTGAQRSATAVIAGVRMTITELK
jgi:hypothetical protein